jgi:hypothetical protein
MKTNIIAVVATLVVAISFAGNAANAQESARYGGPAIRQGDNGTPVIYDHASTLEEGVLRGGADLLRGIGDMNYANSLAMINGQEARARAIENSKAYVQAWHDVRAINREARAANQDTRTSASDLARFARSRSPRGLNAMEFDTTTGKLVWPVALQSKEFAGDRATIDSLVAAHGVEVREVKMLAGDMDKLLKDYVLSMPVSEYVAAKKFLSGLQADASYGPSVASR